VPELQSADNVERPNLSELQKADQLDIRHRHEKVPRLRRGGSGRSAQVPILRLYVS
jgi:hypothetical protein